MGDESRLCRGPGLDPEAAGVYVFFLGGKLTELQGVLVEIDRDYKSP
jgi:hypothetical protein